MELAPLFQEFLGKIRLTDAQKNELQSGHKRLRERLDSFQDLSEHIVSTFLQGSYRRFTAVRPKGETRADIDVIAVTNLSESKFTPAQAMQLFEPFLDKHYKGKWRPQNRSFGIELSAVDFDLVITSAPSEQDKKLLSSDAVQTLEDLSQDRDWRLNLNWISSETRERMMKGAADFRLMEANTQPEWQTSPLRIPDRELLLWQDTHPLEQIVWTREKNASTNGHFVNVVKAVKWWRLENYSEPKHPKGFPLERIVGDCCPDSIGSVAEGITRTLEQIVNRYSSYAAVRLKPFLSDYGVPSHDVLHRISATDFATFYGQAVEGAKLARRALDCGNKGDSAELWRQLLGSRFPLPSDNQSGRSASYTVPASPANPGSGRFA